MSTDAVHSPDTGSPGYRHTGNASPSDLFIRRDSPPHHQFHRKKVLLNSIAKKCLGDAEDGIPSSETDSDWGVIVKEDTVKEDTVVKDAAAAVAENNSVRESAAQADVAVTDKENERESGVAVTEPEGKTERESGSAALVTDVKTERESGAAVTDVKTATDTEVKTEKESGVAGAVTVTEVKTTTDAEIKMERDIAVKTERDSAAQTVAAPTKTSRRTGSITEADRVADDKAQRVSLTPATAADSVTAAATASAEPVTDSTAKETAATAVVEAAAPFIPEPRRTGSVVLDDTKVVADAELQNLQAEGGDEDRKSQGKHEDDESDKERRSNNGAGSGAENHDSDKDGGTSFATASIDSSNITMSVNSIDVKLNLLEKGGEKDVGKLKAAVEGGASGTTAGEKDVETLKPTVGVGGTAAGDGSTSAVAATAPDGTTRTAAGEVTTATVVGDATTAAATATVDIGNTVAVSHNFSIDVGSTAAVIPKSDKTIAVSGTTTTTAADTSGVTVREAATAFSMNVMDDDNAKTETLNAKTTLGLEKAKKPSGAKTSRSTRTGSIEEDQTKDSGTSMNLRMANNAFAILEDDGPDDNGAPTGTTAVTISVSHSPKKDNVISVSHGEDNNNDGDAIAGKTENQSDIAGKTDDIDGSRGRSGSYCTEARREEGKKLHEEKKQKAQGGTESKEDGVTSDAEKSGLSAKGSGSNLAGIVPVRDSSGRTGSIHEGNTEDSSKTEGEQGKGGGKDDGEHHHHGKDGKKGKHHHDKGKDGKDDKDHHHHKGSDKDHKGKDDKDHHHHEGKDDKGKHHHHKGKGDHDKDGGDGKGDGDTATDTKDSGAPTRESAAEGAAAPGEDGDDGGETRKKSSLIAGLLDVPEGADKNLKATDRDKSHMSHITECSMPDTGDNDVLPKGASGSAIGHNLSGHELIKENNNDVHSKGNVISTPGSDKFHQKGGPGIKGTSIDTSGSSGVTQKGDKMGMTLTKGAKGGKWHQAFRPGLSDVHAVVHTNNDMAHIPTHYDGHFHHNRIKSHYSTHDFTILPDEANDKIKFCSLLPEGRVFRPPVSWRKRELWLNLGDVHKSRMPLRPPSNEVYKFIAKESFDYEGLLRDFDKVGLAASNMNSGHVFFIFFPCIPEHTCIGRCILKFLFILEGEFWKRNFYWLVTGKRDPPEGGILSAKPKLDPETGEKIPIYRNGCVKPLVAVLWYLLILALFPYAVIKRVLEEFTGLIVDVISEVENMSSNGILMPKLKKVIRMHNERYQYDRSTRKITLIKPLSHLQGEPEEDGEKEDIDVSNGIGPEHLKQVTKPIDPNEGTVIKKTAAGSALKYLPGGAIIGGPKIMSPAKNLKKEGFNGGMMVVGNENQWKGRKPLGELKGKKNWIPFKGGPGPGFAPGMQGMKGEKGGLGLPSRVSTGKSGSGMNLPSLTEEQMQGKGGVMLDGVHNTEFPSGAETYGGEHEEISTSSSDDSADEKFADIDDVRINIKSSKESNTIVNKEVQEDVNQDVPNDFYEGDHSMTPTGSKFTPGSSGMVQSSSSGSDINQSAGINFNQNVDTSHWRSSVGPGNNNQNSMYNQPIVKKKKKKDEVIPELDNKRSGISAIVADTVVEAEDAFWYYVNGTVDNEASYIRNDIAAGDDHFFLGGAFTNKNSPERMWLVYKPTHSHGSTTDNTKEWAFDSNGRPYFIPDCIDPIDPTSNKVTIAAWPPLGLNIVIRLTDHEIEHIDLGCEILLRKKRNAPFHIRNETVHKMEQWEYKISDYNQPITFMLNAL